MGTPMSQRKIQPILPGKWPDADFVSGFAFIKPKGLLKHLFLLIRREHTKPCGRLCCGLSGHRDGLFPWQ